MFTKSVFCSARNCLFRNQAKILCVTKFEVYQGGNCSIQYVCKVVFGALAWGRWTGHLLCSSHISTTVGVLGRVREGRRGKGRVGEGRGG